MRTVRLPSALCSVALLTLVGTSVAQSAPTLELGKRTAKSHYTLGRIIGVHELPDGRVVVGDAKEGVFRSVDLAKGDVALIGKQGDGPDEYRSAFAIIDGRADSVLLFDLAGRKFLRVSPGGALVGTAPFGNTSTRTRRNGFPAASDSSGAIYYTSIDIDTAMRAFPITSGIRRLESGANTDDEVMRINTRRADQASANGLMVFPFRDAWAVRSDGLMARVLADSYAVLWSRNGKEVGRSGPFAYQPIPITTAEQQLITDSIHAGMKSMGNSVTMGAPAQGTIGSGGSGATVSFGGGGGGQMIVISRSDAGSAAPAGATGDKAAAEAARTALANGTVKTFDPSTIPIAPFPDHRPAILSNATAAAFDGSGMLWVARERARGDVIPRYDVIDQSRGLIAQVKLPAGTRLLGFGRGVVYLARAEDGSDWLERYVMPKW